MRRDDLGRYDLGSLMDGVCIAWSMHLGAYHQKVGMLTYV